MPVCCGFDSVNWLAEPKLNERRLAGERGLAPPRLADSRSAGSSIPLNHSPENENWSLQPGLHRQGRFTKATRRLLHGGKWSQSRVLPSAELAYETGLSAGSTAELEPSLGVAPG